MANYEFLENFDDFIDFYEDEDDRAIPCLNCTGRGKPRPNLSQLKLPSEAYRPSLKEKEERKKLYGRGRAHTLRTVGHDITKARAPGSIVSDSGSSSSAIFSSQSSFKAARNKRVPKNEDDLLSYMSSRQALTPSPELLGKGEQYQDVDSNEFKMSAYEPKGWRDWPGFEKDRKKGFDVKCNQEFPALPSEKSNASLQNAGGTGSFKHISNIIQNSLETTTESNKTDGLDKGFDVEKVMEGPNVLTIENIPDGCEKSSLVELIESFGDVEQFQMSKTGGKTRAQVKMRRESSCEWVISCLNGEEGLVPGKEGEPLLCYRTEENC